MKLYVILALTVILIISVGGIVLNLGSGEPTVKSSTRAAPAPARSTPSSNDNFKF